MQEMAQSLWQKTPVYEVVKTAGPDHARMFTVEVKIGDDIMGKGMGKSKKAAEMEAARSALDRL